MVSFCPLLSTAEKKVACQSNCALYQNDSSDEKKCSIFLLAKDSDERTNSLRVIGNVLYNK